MQAASRLVFWQRPKDVFDGTELLLEATDASSRALIVAGSLSQGRPSVTVDWGDGTVDKVRGSIRNLTHEYGRKGAYRVRISDDIRSFGYTSAMGRTAQRLMLREVVSVGKRVTDLEGYAFNNCKRLEGVVDLRNVTSIGGYAFGTTVRVTELRMPNLTYPNETSFYSGCGASVIRMPKAVCVPYAFFEYFGGQPTDLYLDAMTRAAVGNSAGFPFRARYPVRFHCSDGVLSSDGRYL